MAGPKPSTAIFVIGGPIARADIPGLCDSVRALVARSGADLVVCEVGDLVQADAVAVDALARLQLTARRLGHEVWVRHAGIELQDLLTLTGLHDVVPLCAELPLEASRQAEEREQPRGVEEETDPGDLPV